MTDLSRLVEATAAGSLPYLDPAFPNHLQVLHAARPREWPAIAVARRSGWEAVAQAELRF